MRRILYIITASLLTHAAPVMAEEYRAGGKLLVTNGITSVDGAAGGGLASWAVIAGSETRNGIGGTIHATLLPLPDFDLTSFGGAIGIYDRIELSYARQRFNTRSAGANLGLGQGFTFGQDILGAKVRIAGDAVWDQDLWLPQIAIGVQHKRANRGAVIHAVGGRSDTGTDFILSATKILLSQSLILDATMRVTKANQFGLLGFGGDRHDHYRPQFEGSAGYMLSRRFVVGGELRTKPNNLGFAREQKAIDVFAAWAVARHVSLTAAYVDLGDIATVRQQRGAFLSIQGSY